MMKKGIFLLCFMFSGIILSARVNPLVGPEFYYCYDFRSSAGIGAHLTLSKYRYETEHLVTKSDVLITSVAVRRVFTHRLFYAADFSVKYYLYAHDFGRKFWRPVAGLTLTNYADGSERAFYFAPSVGLTNCGVIDFNIGFPVVLSPKEDLDLYPVTFGFIFRPFNIHFIADKYEK